MPHLQKRRRGRPDLGFVARIRKSGAYVAAGFAIVSICLSPSFLRAPNRSPARTLEPIRQLTEPQAKHKREWGAMTACINRDEKRVDGIFSADAGRKS